MIRKNKRGFSLIEIVAVVAIIAVLALIATVAVVNVVKDNEDEADIAMAATFSSCMQEWADNAVKGNDSLLVQLEHAQYTPEQIQTLVNKTGLGNYAGFGATSYDQIRQEALLAVQTFSDIDVSDGFPTPEKEGYIYAYFFLTGTVKLADEAELLSSGEKYWVSLNTASGVGLEQSMHSLIVFNINDGEGEAPEPMEVGVGQVDLPVTGSFSKGDYSFVGWNSDPLATSGWNSFVVTEEMRGGTYTLYAIWQQSPTTVYRYDLNGGIGTTPDYETIQVSNSETIDLPDDKVGEVSVIVKAGYTFMGWSTDMNATSGVYTTTLSTDQIGREVVWYAVWKEKDRAILHFETEEGMPKFDDLYAPLGETVNLPSGLYKAGKVNVGWIMVNEEGVEISEAMTSLLIIEEHSGKKLTFIPAWVDAVATVITLDANNGSGTIDTIETYHGSVDLPKTIDVTKEGYSFVGWSEEADATKGSFMYTATLSGGNVTLYAVWIETLPTTIKFDLNGGQGTVPETIVSEFLFTHLPTPDATKENCDFSGWAISPFAETGTTMFETDVLGGTYTLYAIWTSKDMSEVVFDLNGGVGTAPTKISTFERTVTLPKTIEATKLNHTFKGWSENPNGSVISNFTYSLISGTQRVILYAIWEPVATEDFSVITFDLNGGQGTTPSSITSGVGVVSLPTPNATKTNYTFYGWSTDANAEKGVTSYSVTEYKTTYKLYAIWVHNCRLIGHNFTEYAQGSVNGHYMACSVCGEKDTKLLPHKLVWKSNEDTHSKICEECGFISITPTAHTKIYSTYTDANHTLECSVCAKAFIEAHKYNAPVVTKEPTCTEDGSQYTQCDCGHKIVTAIDALGHVYGNYVNASLTAHNEVCTRCDAILSTSNHEFEYVANADGKTHRITCVICAFQKSSNAAHNVSCIKISATQHKYECDTCGYVTKTENHIPAYTANNATTHKSTCSACNYVISAEIAHTWKYVDNNNGTHKVVCTVCNYVKSSDAICTYKWETTSTTHKQYCSLCGYVKVNSTAHNWRYTSNSNGTHKIDCSDCQYVKSNSTECTLVWDKTATTHKQYCSLCNYVKIATTAHNLKWETTATTHKQYCDTCEYVTINTASHVWRYTSLGNGNHKIDCSVCQYVKSNSTACTLTWTTTATTHKQHCTLCTYVKVAQENHTWSYTSNSNGTHKVHCETCGYVQTNSTNCSLKWTTTETTHKQHCSLCSYVKVASANHTWSYTSNDNGTHKIYCATCQYVKSSSANCTLKYTSLGSTTHKQHCSLCSYVKVASANHTFAYRSKDGSQHEQYCTACNYVKATASHTLSYASLNSANHKYWCATCGYIKTASEAHAGVNTSNNNGTHSVVCSKCNYKSGTADPCTYKWDTTSTTHKQYCSICNYVKIATANHTLTWVTDGTYHTKSCSVCGYVSVAKTAHTWRYTSLNNGNHKIDCSVCGYVKSSSTACTLIWEKTSTNHKQYCSLCNYVKTASAAHTKVYTSNNNGTHKITCSVCSYTLSSSTNCTLTWTTTSTTHKQHCSLCSYVKVAQANHTWRYTSLNNGNHKIDCSVCGYVNSASTACTLKWTTDTTNHKQHCSLCTYVKVSSTAHTWSYTSNNNGTHKIHCKTCGYVKTSSTACTLTWTTDTTNHKQSCSACGYVKVAQATHTWRYTSLNNGYHKIDCSTCGYVKTNSTACTLSWSTDATNHKKLCSYCGYVSVAQTAHTWRYTSLNNGNHKIDCSVCGYVKSSSTACTLKWTTDATNHKKSCSLCGYVSVATAAHTKKYTSNGDGTHKITCSVCSATLNGSTTCSLTWSKTATNHKQYCSLCNYVKVAQANHSLTWEKTASGHKQYCSVCGYVTVNTTAHTPVNGSSTSCLKKCSVCGYTIASSTNHTFGSYTSVNSTSHKRTCSTCGYVETTNHSLTYVAGSTTGYHKQTCSACGYSSGDVACSISFYRNVFTNDEGSGADVNSDCAHIGYCVCNATVGNREAHTLTRTSDDHECYVACEVCDYMRTNSVHSWKKVYSQTTPVKVEVYKCYYCAKTYQITGSQTLECTHSSVTVTSTSTTYESISAWDITRVTEYITCSSCGATGTRKRSWIYYTTNPATSRWTEYEYSWS